MSPRLRRRGTAALLTLLFAGLFVGLRSIPISQCEFLHYDTDPNAASLSGEEELCSVAPVPFLNVAEQPFPVALEEESFERLPDGRMELLFRLLDPSGEDLLPHELALTHTKRVHFMLIDGQLGSYHHLHPEPLGNSGLYRVRFHPRSEDYRYFAEFVPKRTRQLAIADGFLDTGVRTRKIGWSIFPSKCPWRDSTPGCAPIATTGSSCDCATRTGNRSLWGRR